MTHHIGQVDNTKDPNDTKYPRKKESGDVTEVTGKTVHRKYGTPRKPPRSMTTG